MGRKNSKSRAAIDRMAAQAARRAATICPEHPGEAPFNAPHDIYDGSLADAKLMEGGAEGGELIDFNKNEEVGCTALDVGDAPSAPTFSDEVVPLVSADPTGMQMVYGVEAGLPLEAEIGKVSLAPLVALQGDHHISMTNGGTTLVSSANGLIFTPSFCCYEDSF